MDWVFRLSSRRDTYSRTLIGDFARCMARGGRRAPELLTEGDASGMHGAECFVPYLSLTPVSNPCWRACCAEYFSRTAPGRWSVIGDFAATSWGVGARACVMKIGSLFRYGYPCRGIRASVHGWIWGNSLCSGLDTRAHDHASQDPLRGPISPFQASALCQCRCVTSNTCPHALS